MLHIYGSVLCKDCVQCVKELNDENVSHELPDFSHGPGKELM